MLNLSNPKDREKLEELLSEDIDKFCETFYEQGHRNHLGASTLGEPCWRKLYYSFRWVKEERFDGRMMRLFNVGHSAEPRFVSYLRGIGFEVREFDEDGKQFRISGANGHYGGSLDGLCKPPARYEIEGDLIFLNEFKTNATGAKYADVETKGVAKAKPMHYAQMSQYGYKYGLRYGLYMIENKNDSDITIKIVELDWNLGAQLEKKATDIISSKEPPARISENPAMNDCKFCVYSEICHSNSPVEINCRSCRHAKPVEDAKWHCYKFDSIIPIDFIRRGCEHHLPIS
jgi:CRISPR/Cas system-associated exonuclease Cas4 (RecB family)